MKHHLNPGVGIGPGSHGPLVRLLTASTRQRIPEDRKSLASSRCFDQEKDDLLTPEELDKEPSATVGAIGKVMKPTAEMEAIVVLDEDRMHPVQESASLEHCLVLELETNVAEQELEGVLVEGKLPADERQRAPTA